MTAVTVAVEGATKVRAALEKRQAEIRANGIRATKAYADVVAKAANARAQQ